MGFRGPFERVKEVLQTCIVLGIYKNGETHGKNK